MGEPVLLLSRVPGTTRSRVIEANCGDAQMEADRLELGFRVAAWLREPSERPSSCECRAVAMEVIAM